MKARRAYRASLAICVLAMSVAACASEPPASSAPPGEPLVLRLAPVGLACDAIGVDYDLVTLRIDPGADEHVSGITDDGRVLLTYWSAGFLAGTAADPVIRDPEGHVVARDGDVVPIPPAAWPRLHGHLVCPTPDALYILVEDPA